MNMAITLRPRPHRRGHSHSPSWGQMPPRPPMEAQQFGKGAPSNYRFQYSACTGRRKALLIGINYAGQPNALRGCINDVTNMSTFLHERYGYRREDMVILTDDQQNPMSVPTKANILRAMQWLVKDAQRNDSLFIHFSGKIIAVAQTAIGFLKKAALGESARERTVKTKTSPADVVMFSGSKDTQTS
ncbi:unnamed protein product [Aspergillus oryzae]|uniref:Unnamed protein product n=1 Tax=Aspergillus oryzae var. brunneus TaxID=332754 RepID=A0ABQ6KR02_ASPOZ|nr:unnamed protein product [Aspergillus oryzae]GMF85023.1 unnamed protein product [Aspergillus oryzae]GMG14594.1 unnamed protein product [Aspergillus oryzae]GMG45778.1 unnamed protein product [Aspergillus oryzae var. brunneus]